MNGGVNSGCVMKKILIVPILFCSLIITAYAGPFGMEMGMPITQIQKKLNLTPTEVPGVYKTNRLIKSHPRFDDYRLSFSPDTGLCKIVAWSKSIKTSVYGEGATGFFTNLVGTLEVKYGQPTIFDSLNPGSIWNEPKDWMMGLNKKERRLVAFWVPDDRQLPENLAGISVDTFALDLETAIYSLTYEFKNIDKCNEWKKANLDDAL